jgi:hypothetical protein
MRRVFVVDRDGHSEPMEPIHCADETKELQELLAHNFDLLAGDQITPEGDHKSLNVEKFHVYAVLLSGGLPGAG